MGKRRREKPFYYGYKFIIKYCDLMPLIQIHSTHIFNCPCLLTVEIFFVNNLEFDFLEHFMEPLPLSFLS